MARQRKTGALAQLNLDHTTELIELYHSHSALWDARTREYRNRDVKLASWTSVRVNFSASTNIKCTDEEIQAKLTSLRNQFTRELRAIKDTKKSGSDVHKPSWPFFDRLSFLTPVITMAGPTTSNMRVQEEGPLVLTCSQEPSHQDDSPDTGSPDLPEDIEMLMTTSEEDQDWNGDVSTSTPARAPRMTTKRKASAPSDVLRVKIRECVNKRENTEYQDSPDLIWARNLIQNIAQISDEKKRKLLKLDVDDLVNKALRADLTDQM